MAVDTAAIRVKPDAAGIPLQRPGRLHQWGGRLPATRLHSRAYSLPARSVRAAHRIPEMSGRMSIRSPTSRSVAARAANPGFRPGRGALRALRRGAAVVEVSPERPHIRHRFPGAGSEGPRPVTRPRRIVVWIYQTVLSRNRFKP